MENISLEKIFILLLIIVLPLANWLLMQLLAKRRAGRLAAEEQSRPQIPRGTQETAPKPETLLVRERVLAAPAQRMPPRRTRYQTMRLLLRNEREVRRGIIMMTVLGTCRALERPE